MAVFLGCTSTDRVGFMLFVVLCPGTPEGSTGSGSGFKASQKTGQRLKVSSDDFSKMIINPYVTTIKLGKLIR